MIKSYPLLKPLTDQLMKEVRAYGILEVSLEQYQIVCNSIVRFAQSLQVDSYKRYITHDTHQISFVAMDFSDVPITSGFYFGHTESAGSLEGGAGA